MGESEANFMAEEGELLASPVPPERKPFRNLNGRKPFVPFWNVVCVGDWDSGVCVFGETEPELFPAIPFQIARGFDAAEAVVE